MTTTADYTEQYRSDWASICRDAHELRGYLAAVHPYSEVERISVEKRWDWIEEKVLPQLGKLYVDGSRWYALDRYVLPRASQPRGSHLRRSFEIGRSLLAILTGVRSDKDMTDEVILFVEGVLDHLGRLEEKVPA
jgi:hypothetical protein